MFADEATDVGFLGDGDAYVFLGHEAEHNNEYGDDDGGAKEAADGAAYAFDASSEGKGHEALKDEAEYPHEDEG